MGWLGSSKHLLEALREAKADADEDGLFFIYGAGVAYCMGDTSDDAECVVPDITEYSVDGVRHNLGEMLNARQDHAGGVGVVVI